MAKTDPHSLYGYSFLIRNILRGGGPSADDDSYSLRLIGEEILTQAAFVRQAELYDLFNRGLQPDVTQMVVSELTLEDYEGIEMVDQPVVLRKATLPQTLVWGSNPAVFGLMTRPEKPGWGVKKSAYEAIRSAKGRMMVPGYPAGWFDRLTLNVALPLPWSGVDKIYARFIPSRVNINARGEVMDREREALTINETQWAKIKPLVLQGIQGMVATSQNRDTRNDGKDTVTQQGS
jgi:hypothetical protein